VRKSASETYQSTEFLTLSLLGLGILTALVLAALIVRSVGRGIASVVAPMHSLATGDLSVEVPHHGERNEIGMIANAIEVFKEALIAKRGTDA
jgi:methyl-accepting chemotaxis protein